MGKRLKIVETFKTYQKHAIVHNTQYWVLYEWCNGIFTVPECCLYAICHSSQLSNPSDATLCTMKPLINANMSMLQCTCHTSTCSSLCLVSGYWGVIYVWIAILDARNSIAQIYTEEGMRCCVLLHVFDMFWKSLQFWAFFPHHLVCYLTFPAQSPCAIDLCIL